MVIALANSRQPAHRRFQRSLRVCDARRRHRSEIHADPRRLVRRRFGFVPGRAGRERGFRPPHPRSVERDGFTAARGMFRPCHRGGVVSELGISDRLLGGRRRHAEQPLLASTTGIRGSHWSFAPARTVFYQMVVTGNCVNAASAVTKASDSISAWAASILSKGSLTGVG